MIGEKTFEDIIILRMVFALELLKQNELLDNRLIVNYVLYLLTKDGNLKYRSGEMEQTTYNKIIKKCSENNNTNFYKLFVKAYLIYRRNNVTIKDETKLENFEKFKKIIVKRSDADLLGDIYV